MSYISTNFDSCQISSPERIRTDNGDDAADYEAQEVVCQDMSLLPDVVKQAQVLDEGFM